MPRPPPGTRAGQDVAWYGSGDGRAPVPRPVIWIPVLSENKEERTSVTRPSGAADGIVALLPSRPGLVGSAPGSVAPSALAGLAPSPPRDLNLPGWSPSFRVKLHSRFALVDKRKKKDGKFAIYVYVFVFTGK